jgi:hypothetical protein
VTVPTGEKLDEARPLESFGFGKESLLGVEVGRAGARLEF